MTESESNAESVIRQKQEWLAEVRDCLSSFGYHPPSGMISGAALTSQIRRMHGDLMEARSKNRDLEAFIGRMVFNEEAGRG